MNRLAAIHLKDWVRAYGRSYHRYARGFTELGTGDLTPILEEVIARLLKIDYQGWIVSEQDYTEYTSGQSACQNAEWLQSRNVPIAPRRASKDIFFQQAVLLPIPNTYSDTDLLTFEQSLQKAGASELPDCYRQIADAVRDLCDCHVVAIWACDPTRDELNLLATSPPLASLLPHMPVPAESEAIESVPVRTVLTAKGSLLGIALERREVTPFDLLEPKPGAKYDYPAAQFQWKDLLKAYPATRLIGFPVMNLYNLHHVRCLVGLLPRATDIPMDLEDSYWQNNPFGFGADLSRTVDASLNDLCALAAAKTNLLAGDYRDTSAFANALAAHIRKTIHCEGVSNFLVNATGDRLQCAGTTGIKWSVPITEQFYKRNEKTTGLVWEQNEPLLFRNIKADNPKHEAKSREFGGGVNEDRDNVLFVPLVNYKGDVKGNFKANVKGIMRCRNKRPVQATEEAGEETIFTHDDAAVVDVIGQAAMPHFDILQSYAQRARSVARLTHELSLPLIAIRGCVDLMQEELGAFTEGAQMVFDYDYMGDIWSWSDLMLGLQGNADLYGSPSERLLLK